MSESLKVVPLSVVQKYAKKSLGEKSDIYFNLEEDDLVNEAGEKQSFKIKPEQKQSNE